MHPNKIQLRSHNPGTVRRLELVNSAADEQALYVYGTIGDFGWGDGITAKDFATALNQATAATLRLHINSPGGDVFEGVAMAQAIREYKGTIVAQVDGLAASAATQLTTAAKRTEMAPGSMLMVHRAWTVVAGNTEDLLAQAAVLEKIDGQIAKAYADRSGATVEQAAAWMQAETWFTESEAVAAGLADAALGEDSEDEQDGGADEKTEGANALARKWALSDSPFKCAPDALKAAATETVVEPGQTAAIEAYERTKRLAALL